MDQISNDTLPTHADGRVMTHAEFVTPLPGEIEAALDISYGTIDNRQTSDDPTSGDLTLTLIVRRHFEGYNNTQPETTAVRSISQASGGIRADRQGKDAHLDLDYGRNPALKAAEDACRDAILHPENIPDGITASSLNRSYESEAHTRRGLQLAIAEGADGDSSKEIPFIWPMDMLREAAQAVGSTLEENKTFDQPALWIRGQGGRYGEAGWTALTAHHSDGKSGWEEPMSDRGTVIKDTLAEIVRGYCLRTGKDTMRLQLGSHAKTIKAICKAYYPHQEPISLGNGQEAEFTVKVNSTGSSVVDFKTRGPVPLRYSLPDPYFLASLASFDSIDPMSVMCSTLT